MWCRDFSWIHRLGCKEELHYLNFKPKCCTLYQLGVNSQRREFLLELLRVKHASRVDRARSPHMCLLRYKKRQCMQTRQPDFRRHIQSLKQSWSSRQVAVRYSQYLSLLLPVSRYSKKDSCSWLSLLDSNKKMLSLLKSKSPRNYYCRFVKTHFQQFH